MAAWFPVGINDTQTASKLGEQRLGIFILDPPSGRTGDAELPFYCAELECWGAGVDQLICEAFWVVAGGLSLYWAGRNEVARIERKLERLWIYKGKNNFPFFRSRRLNLENDLSVCRISCITFLEPGNFLPRF
jgi:hypothetical protein